jgi:hypothetical protein
MNRIIALRGKGDSGKTATIWMLHALLGRHGYTPIPGMFHGRKDVFDILQKNGRLVGITSAGDSFRIVQDRLQALIDNRCQICVCACRSFDRANNGTNAAIASFNPPYTVMYTDKTVQPVLHLQAAANGRDARHLLDVVESLVVR